MAKKRSRKRSSKRISAPNLDLQPETRRTIVGIVKVALGVLFLLSIKNQAGVLGSSLYKLLTLFFGSWGIVFPFVLLASGILSLFGGGESRLEAKRTLGLAVMLCAFLGLMHIGAPLDEIGPRQRELAGAIGFMMSLPFLLFTSREVGYAILTAGFFIGFILSFEPNLGALFSMLKSEPKKMMKPEKAEKMSKKEKVLSEEKEVFEEDETDDADLVEEGGEEPELNIVRPAFAQSIVRAKTEKSIKEKLKMVAGDILEMKDTRFEEWTFPSLDLLDTEHSELMVDDEELKTQAKLIEEKLGEFGIEVTVRDARPGPTVTQFTLQPAEGVKLSKIGSLKDDLSLALAAQALRIEAPIPGKSLVGIEMPNRNRSTVRLREILESPAFSESNSTLTLPLGRDVSGESVTASLEDMPHLLIAGATGSGKSVCMNTFLTAMLYQNAPHELKFILIDPKRVELMPYNGIPHLLTPVITEAEKALQALRWAVAEMGRRLHRLSEQGARNIQEYNEKQTDEANLLPRIVVVIDELADLMMRQYRRDTETMIARIAQMARAVGMHLIIATQRPSVDVITGLIKANIPTRMAFRVVSAVDSRTILDSIGAEDLLGKGDMLYMNAATPKPVRIQGIYLSTKEVERVINAVKIAGGGKVTEQIGLAEDDEATMGDESDIGISGGRQPMTIDLDADDNGGDDLFFDAVRAVQEMGKASASLLQRHLKVGYARAARLLDIMEEKGIVGPADGAKPRKVYIEKMIQDAPEPAGTTPDGM
jgi:DNA segregation ATPase FtsK/SpoIIIE, S-DNA-T family